MPFPRSPYGRADLFVALGEIARFANGDTPASITTRAFDAVRAAAGHPRCPTAKVICFRLRLSWPEAKRIALEPKRSIALTVARRYTASPRDCNLTLTEVIFALKTVALRLGQRTLAQPQYAAERERMIDAGLATLPTVEQMIGVTGSWGAALSATGLEPSGRRDLPSLSIEDALDLHFEKYGFVCSPGDLQKFAAAEGLRMQSHGARRWSVVLAGWRRSYKERGIVVPKRPTSTPRIDYGPPVPWELTDRVKRSWTDGEIIDAFLRAWDRLKSGEELTFRRYTALHETDKRLPGTNTLRWGSRPGFAFYRDRSREIRLAVLATA